MELIPAGPPNSPSLPPDTSVVSSVTSTIDTTRHGIFMKAAISSATSCDACKTARTFVRMSHLPELFSLPKTCAEISYSNGTICEIISNSAVTFATTDSFRNCKKHRSLLHF